MDFHDPRPLNLAISLTGASFQTCLVEMTWTYVVAAKGI